MSGRLPIGAAICTLIGGFFIAIGGVLEASFIAFFALFVPSLSNTAHLFEIGGLSVGVLAILMGVLMLVSPQHTKIWGILAIVLAIPSLIFSFVGGFLIGFILAIVGGALAIGWEASPPPMGTYQPMPGGMMPPPPPPPGPAFPPPPQ